MHGISTEWYRSITDEETKLNICNKYFEKLMSFCWNYQVFLGNNGIILEQARQNIGTFRIIFCSVFFVKTD